MDSIRYLRASEGWCSMELKLHIAAPQKRRRPGSQTVITCKDASHPCRNQRNLHFQSVNKAIFTTKQHVVIAQTLGKKNMFAFSFLFHPLSRLDVGRFPARLERAGIKATLKINPLWLIYSLSCQVNLKWKQFKCVFKSSKVLRRDLSLIQNSERARLPFAVHRSCVLSRQSK